MSYEANGYKASLCCFSKAIGAFFCALLLAVTMGCSGGSSDRRVRLALGISEGEQLTEVLVAQKVMTMLGAGTPAASLAQKVNHMGVGRDALSSFHLEAQDRVAFIRVEFDPNTLGFVKTSWIISLHLDDQQRLTSATARRHLTGL